MNDVVHPCPGCPSEIPSDAIACTGCHRRLPREIRHALVVGHRRRHRDHGCYLDALAAARVWWADNRAVSR